MNNALMIKETGSHYTSALLSNFMSKKLVEHVDFFESSLKETYETVLDPSCGNGDLLNAVLQEKGIKKLEVLGMDTNPEAIQFAKKRFDITNNENIKFFNDDYLKLFNEENTDLFSEIIEREEYWSSKSEDDGLKKVDTIIANPPYVRTQVLGGEQAQTLAKKFKLKGRVDLYQVFLVAMTKHLKENGLICVITSNRYLTTTGGKDIRKFLDENYEILEIIDLGDTKLFDAAVLPAIFIGRKKSKNENIKNDKVNFYRIYENPLLENTEECTTIFDVLNKKDSGSYEVGGKKYEVTIGQLKVPKKPEELWVMASKEDNLWASKVKENAKFKFLDVFNVKVGIKTTADKIFIRNDWEELDESMQPESEILKPLISSDATNKWVLPKVEKLKILYPHEVVDDKRQAIDLNKFPKAKAYLESHKEQLESRKYVIEANRNWYEIWVPQDPDKWVLPKVIFPDISSEPKFAVDTNGNFVDGNCYWLSLIEEKNIDLLYLASVVANSKLMTKFHKIEFQNQLYSGKNRYLTQYVKNYPLPDPDSIYSKKLIKLGKKLHDPSLNIEAIQEYEAQIEVEVYKAFGL